MSPTFNLSSALQHFSHSNVIEIHNGTEALPHVCHVGPPINFIVMELKGETCVMAFKILKC